MKTLLLNSLRVDLFDCIPKPRFYHFVSQIFHFWQFSMNTEQLTPIKKISS
jgi:hypothetical protein